MKHIQKETIGVAAVVGLGVGLLALLVELGQWRFPRREAAQLEHYSEQEIADESDGLCCRLKLFVKNLTSTPGQNVLIMLEPPDCEIHSPNRIINSIQRSGSQCLVSLNSIGSLDQIELIATAPKSHRLRGFPSLIEVKCDDGPSNCDITKCKTSVLAEDVLRMVRKHSQSDRSKAAFAN